MRFAPLSLKERCGGASTNGTLASPASITVTWLKRERASLSAASSRVATPSVSHTALAGCGMFGPKPTPAVERMYVFDCGTNRTNDLSRWSPGVNDPTYDINLKEAERKCLPPNRDWEFGPGTGLGTAALVSAGGRFAALVATQLEG